MRTSDYSHLLANHTANSPTPLRVRDDSDKSRHSFKQSPEIDSLNQQIDRMRSKAQYQVYDMGDQMSRLMRLQEEIELKYKQSQVDNLMLNRALML